MRDRFARAMSGEKGVKCVVMPRTVMRAMYPGKGRQMLGYSADVTTTISAIRAAARQTARCNADAFFDTPRCFDACTPSALAEPPVEEVFSHPGR